MTIAAGTKIELRHHVDIVKWMWGLKGLVTGPGSKPGLYYAEMEVPPDLSYEDGGDYSKYMRRDSATGKVSMTIDVSTQYFKVINDLTPEQRQLLAELKSKKSLSPVEDYILSELEK